MFGLDKEFYRIINKQLKAKNLLTRLLNKHFLNHEINLSKDEISFIVNKILETESDIFDFDISDDRVKEIGFNDSNKFQAALDSAIGEAFDDIDGYSDRVINSLQETIQELIPSISKDIFFYAQKREKKMLRERNKIHNDFKKELKNKWEPILKKMEVLRVTCLEAGDFFNNEYREESTSNNDFVFDVLTRLLARASQIYFEVIVLLQNGFADGALARWRTMHEISVIAFFIKDNGNETAERYLDFEHIESFKAARTYQKNASNLGMEMISSKEYSILEENYNYMIDKYGKDFKTDYGWASKSLGIKRPFFDQIESSVSLGYLRPYYNMASYNVHSNPKGIFFKLGIQDNIRNALLAGPSLYGLSNPIHKSSLALSQIATATLTHIPNIDTLVLTQIISNFLSQIETELDHLSSKKS